MSEVISFEAHRAERRGYWLALADRMDRYADGFERLDKLLLRIDGTPTNAESVAADCRAVAEYLRSEWDTK